MFDAILRHPYALTVSHTLTLEIVMNINQIPPILTLCLSQALTESVKGPQNCQHKRDCNPSTTRWDTVTNIVLTTLIHYTRLTKLSLSLLPTPTCQCPQMLWIITRSWYEPPINDTNKPPMTSLSWERGIYVETFQSLFEVWVAVYSSVAPLLDKGWSLEAHSCRRLMLKDLVITINTCGC